MTVVERRSLIWGATIVLAIAAAWLTPSPPGQQEDPRIMRPFADLVLAGINARSIEDLDGGRSSWLITYDIKAIKHVRCPGGLDVIRTIYEVLEDGDAIEPKWTVIQPEVAEQPVTGPVELSNAEIPLSLPLVLGAEYEAQIAVRCLDEQHRPIGLEAASQRMRFRAE